MRAHPAASALAPLRASPLPARNRVADAAGFRGGGIPFSFGDGPRRALPPGGASGPIPARRRSGASTRPCRHRAAPLSGNLHPGHPHARAAAPPAGAGGRALRPTPGEPSAPRRWRRLPPRRPCARALALCKVNGSSTERPALPCRRPQALSPAGRPALGLLSVPRVPAAAGPGPHPGCGALRTPLCLWSRPLVRQCRSRPPRGAARAGRPPCRPCCPCRRARAGRRSFGRPAPWPILAHPPCHARRAPAGRRHRRG